MLLPPRQENLYRYLAELSGEINGETVDVNGFGLLDEDRGFVSGTYDLNNFPQGLDPRVLMTCLVTGYPNCTRDTEKLPNPFKVVESYQYSRSISTQDQSVKLDLKTCVKKEKGVLKSKFLVNGNVDQEVEFFEENLFHENLTLQENGFSGSFGFETPKSNIIAHSKYPLDFNENRDILRRTRSLDLKCLVRGERLLLVQSSAYTDASA